MSRPRTSTKHVSPLAHRRRRAPRGQAMVEYSVVTHALLGMGVVGLMPLIFGNRGLLAALNTFYDSVYFVLSTGAF